MCTPTSYLGTNQSDRSTWLGDFQKFAILNPAFQFDGYFLAYILFTP